MVHNFEKFCKDYTNIENYEKAKADNFKGWCIHHRLETHNSYGERRLVNISAAELQALGMYWNRPASELIFMKHSEHTQLHQKGEDNSFYGRRHSEESKKKMSESQKGKRTGEDNPFYGKHHSEETRKKWSEARKGNRWFNNGKINKFCHECPDGFIPGQLLILK